MARGIWGVDIRSLETGEALFELNDGRLMMPASNMSKPVFYLKPT